MRNIFFSFFQKTFNWSLNILYFVLYFFLFFFFFYKNHVLNKRKFKKKLYNNKLNIQNY